MWEGRVPWPPLGARFHVSTPTLVCCNRGAFGQLAYALTVAVFRRCSFLAASFMFWTLLHGLSLAPASMIKDCHIYCILSCTGWTSRSGSCISLLRWSTDVSRTRRRSICRTTACQSLKLPVVITCDLPLVISFYWSHNIVSEHSIIGLLLWLARRSGTHWQMNCELTLVIGLN